jgi:long-chain acyl-CoA synthetase
VARDTLIDFFRDLIRERGIGLVYDDGFRSRRHTYDEIGRGAGRFAARLHDLGLRKGDRVIFWSENRPEWIVAFWGCLLRGIVVVPIDYRASPEFLARVRSIVSARLVLVGQDVAPVPGAIDVPIWNLHEVDWTTGDAPPPPAVPIARSDVAEIIFTSGAIADPKGVMITHGNVLANIVPVEREIRRYRKWARPFSPLRFLNLLPLSHMFGQAMGAFVPAMLGGEVIFMRGYSPVEIVAQIRSRRISVLVSVPRILEVLREHITHVDRAARALQASGDRSGRHFVWRWWRYRGVHRIFGPKFWAFVVGAAPLDPELETFWGELGFAVVQGYGLTETAPIVSLNHPFAMKAGSVGKAIEGVEVKIAPDGEILVRGENVTQGYFNEAPETASAFEGGWFHTGDVGELAEDGQLYIRGRKKEMIVTPEGLNVFPEDVERVLNRIAGVRDSAVVGAPVGAGASGAAGGPDERVHAVLVVDRDVDPEAVVREANAHLDDHQKIRRALVWPDLELPRTEGTRKLKRAAIREWVRTGTPPRALPPGHDQLEALIARYAGRTDLTPRTTLEELGLTSLDRVELMVALEDAFKTRIDESSFSDARDLAQLRTLVERSATGATLPPEPADFPGWNRSWAARVIRRVSLPLLILPLARAFAWIHVQGREHLKSIDTPAVFAANHQSHMDAPVILAALPRALRYRVAPAMAKEFFEPHFHPDGYGRGVRFASGLGYYLAALFFNAFPLPQREAGARQTLRYIGDLLEDGFSLLIFPEGERTETGEIERFRAGVGMIASRLDVPVVPVRIEGLDKVLHRSWHMARPGHVRVAFGAPLHFGAGSRPSSRSGDLSQAGHGKQLRSAAEVDNTSYEAVARQVEEAVRSL